MRKWDGDIRERELAEKRRVAPGWLDVEVGERGLVPERSGGGQHHGVGAGGGSAGVGVEMMEVDAKDEGEELDRAFGGLGIR